MTTINGIDSWKYYYSSQPAQTQMKLSESYAMAAFLLSPANRTARGFFDMESVKRTYESSAVQESKTGIAVVMEYFTPISPILFSTPAEDDCDKVLVSSTKKAKIFNVDKKFAPAATLVVDGDYINCNTESRMEMKARQFNEYLPALLTAFAGEVDKFVYSTKMGLFADGSTSKSVCLFQSTLSTLNPMGEIAMGQYIQDTGNNPEDFRFFGGVRLNTYARLKGITTADVSGFNTQNLDIFDNRRFFYDSSIGATTGLVNGFIALKPGALQLITATRFTQESGNYLDTPNLKQYTIQDPIFGLNWDVREELTTNCDGKVVTTFQFSICWNVIGYPNCNDQLDYRNGVTDGFLFEGLCCDETPCDLEARVTDPASISRAKNDVSCAEECVADCTTTIAYSVGLEGSLVVNVNINSPIGGTNTIVLNLNGAPILPLAGNPNVFIIANGGWAEGDTLNAVITGTCNENVSTVVDVPSAGIALNIDGDEFVDGDVDALGNTPVATQFVLPVFIQNNSQVALTVTSVAITGVNAGTLTAFPVPLVIPAGGASVVKVFTSNVTLGAHTDTITVLSNDSATPTMAVNITYTVTP